jgi:hypothetical protein
MTKIAGSESGTSSQRHGSSDSDPDPDTPHNVMDPQHCLLHVCLREMKLHFSESGHTPTKSVVCECGKKFAGGVHGGYRYHRFVTV